MNQLKTLKIWLKLRFISFTDLCFGYAFGFAKKSKGNLTFPFSFELSQEIKPSETINDKIYNIRVAANKINEYVLMPNQIFSFWNIVGDPNSELRKSRSIIKGKVSNEIGGGICQVSGIIYHACISAGLQIIQRHNHSVDLYTDETRFTPLGTDAAVVYGYKDLRIRNSLSTPIQFELIVIEKVLTIKLLSTSRIEKKALTYEREIRENHIIAIVKDENNSMINKSVYKNLSEHIPVI